MKVTENGITVDCDALRSAFLPSRHFDLHKLFEAITVDEQYPTQAAPDEEIVVIPTGGSSAIDYAVYTPKNEVLLVKFVEGGMYRYQGIDLQLAFDFAAAPSKGGFFASRIKNRHVAEKV